MASNETNYTMTELKNTNIRTTWETAISVLFLLLIMIIAIIGNTAVIAVICKQKTMKKDVSNLLIINLSITDLSNTLLVMMSALVALVMDEWPFGEIWCACTCAINYCLIIVSMLTLCCISVDRYQAVMHPLSYPLRITRKRLTAIIVYTWIQGSVFGIAPSALHWVDYDYWEAICAIQWHLYRPDSLIYVILAFILCFLGPGIILIYCYTIILKEVKKQKIQYAQSPPCDRKSSDRNKRKVSDRAKITWSLLTVVLAYFICTTPFSVTKLIKVSAGNQNIVPGPINLVASLLGYVASAINPLIYGIFRKDFRKAYIQFLKSVFGCQEMSQIQNTSDALTQSVSNCITNSNQVTSGRESSMQLHNQLAILDQMTLRQNGNATSKTKSVSIQDQYKSTETVLVEIPEKNGDCMMEKRLSDNDTISCTCQVNVKSIDNTD